ncbi:MAG: glutamate 5-kinase [Gemmatimonadota bacterium]
MGQRAGRQAQPGVPLTRETLQRANRIVIKAGTRTILDDNQRPDLVTLGRLFGEMMSLKKAGKEVIFVSSGAIATGLQPLGLSKRPGSIPSLQAAAAVGQSLLMQIYNDLLSPFGCSVAQLLLTHDDFQHRSRYLNLRNLLTSLEGKNVLPIINENDTVAVDEIKFGDNDILSGFVANAVDAEVTVLLSDVDGFFLNGVLLKEVEEVTPALEMAAGGTAGFGRGGMVSKIRCARMVTAAGGWLVLVHGKKVTVYEALAVQAGTVFRPMGTRLDRRKRWIAHTLKAVGSVTVDAGGAKALTHNGRSLLAVGVTACEGGFDVGDPVVVRDPSGAEIAKGLVNYAAADLRRILGRRTDEIPGILGCHSFEEIIHRNNLVLLN